MSSKATCGISTHGIWYIPFIRVQHYIIMIPTDRWDCMSPVYIISIPTICSILLFRQTDRIAKDIPEHPTLSHVYLPIRTVHSIPPYQQTDAWDIPLCPMSTFLPSIPSHCTNKDCMSCPRTSLSVSCLPLNPYHSSHPTVPTDIWNCMGCPRTFYSVPYLTLKPYCSSHPAVHVLIDRWGHPWTSHSVPCLLFYHPSLFILTTDEWDYMGRPRTSRPVPCLPFHRPFLSIIPTDEWDCMGCPRTSHPLSCLPFYHPFLSIVPTDEWDCMGTSCPVPCVPFYHPSLSIVPTDEWDCMRCPRTSHPVLHVPLNAYCLSNPTVPTNRWDTFQDIPLCPIFNSKFLLSIPSHCTNRQMELHGTSQYIPLCHMSINPYGPSHPAIPIKYGV